MEIASGLLHGLDLLAAALLTGALVHSRAIGRGRDDALLRRLAASAFLASALWTLGAARGMADSGAMTALWQSLAATSFGRYAGLKLATLAAISISLRLRRHAAALALGLALPIFSGLTGHAGAETSGVALGLAVDYAHFLAVAIWSGGLLALAAALGRSLAEKDPDFSGTRADARGFSRRALGAVLAIAATGVVAAGRFGVSWRAPWETGYGKLLLLKTVFFCAALAAAAVNRFVHMRRADDGPRFARALLRTIAFELSAVLLAFLAAGLLTGAMLPGE